MKSLILLVALLMDEARPGGFVFHRRALRSPGRSDIDRVGAFLRATRAQSLITTPVTHNANVFQPAQLTLVTRRKAARIGPRLWRLAERCDLPDAHKHFRSSLDATDYRPHQSSLGPLEHRIVWILRTVEEINQYV